MVTLFYILAFIGFLKAQTTEVSTRRLWQTASYVCLACALLTKEMAVTFGLMVMAYEWLSSRPGGPARGLRLWRSFISAAPYFLITFAYFPLRWFALRRGAKLDPNHTTFDVLITWPFTLFTYLRLLIFPKGLSGLYYSTYALPPGFWNFVFPLAALCMFGAIVVYWARRTNDRIVTFSVLWMVIGLIPVLYLRALPDGKAVKDRYLYLASVGFVVLLARAIRGVRFRNEEAKSTRVQLAIVLAICAAFIAGVLVQQVYWGNDLLLFYRGYQLYPQNVDGTMELAAAFMKRHDYGRALPILTDLIHDHPHDGPPHYYLAQAYLQLGQKAQARQALQKALELSPEVAQSSTGQSDIATLFAQLGDYHTAVGLYREALREEPDLYSANYNCGYMYFLLQQDTEAEKLLLHAEKVGPGIASPLFYLGRIYLRAGNGPLSEAYFRKALSIDPKQYDFHYWLGQALAATGHLDQAKKEYAEELKLHPENPNAIAELTSKSQQNEIQKP